MCARRRRRQRSRVEVERAADRRRRTPACAGVDDRVGGGRPGERGGDHLVALAHTGREQRQVKRGRCRTRWRSRGGRRRRRRTAARARTVRGPLVSQPDRSVSITDAISSSPITGGENSSSVSRTGVPPSIAGVEGLVLLMRPRIEPRRPPIRACFSASSRSCRPLRSHSRPGRWRCAAGRSGVPAHDRRWPQAGRRSTPARPPGARRNSITQAPADAAPGRPRRPAGPAPPAPPPRPGRRRRRGGRSRSRGRRPAAPPPP